MKRALKISVSQYSDRGRKDVNQDFYGLLIPEEPQLALKGIAIALADGISSSDVSQIASESAVKSFLMDYYCTSDAWSVKSSVYRVISATNSWLHSQTRRSPYAFEKDKGYVCTLSAMVLKSTTAHVFHVGDSRIYRLANGALEQLTEDHRVIVSSQQNYLSRALGLNARLDIDYRVQGLQLGDVFVLMTDGAYDFVSPRFIIETISRAPLDGVAEILGREAYRNGSPDNITVQVVRVDDLPDREAGDIFGQASDLPCPPLLDARMEFEGYRILREVHASSRSHIYLAVDIAEGSKVAIKIPSIDLRGDAAYLTRFMSEEWIGRRINNAHVLKTCVPTRKRNYLYVVSEFLEGQTLTQWMIDHPAPELEVVRGIVEQIARGLQAFHRLEMLHQDLRPDNIMIDKTGTVKIIDFGSARVAGVIEAAPATDVNEILGTVQYTAPEYFLGEGGSPRSDLYSLGVVTYQMLTGRLPYGANVSQTRTRSQQSKLHYRSALDETRPIPAWIDPVLRRAVHPDPSKRYGELSAFAHDLRHPRQMPKTATTPLIERNPLVFWKSVSLLLLAIIFLLLARQHMG